MSSDRPKPNWVSKRVLIKVTNHMLNEVSNEILAKMKGKNDLLLNQMIEMSNEILNNLYNEILNIMTDEIAN